MEVQDPNKKYWFNKIATDELKGELNKIKKMEVFVWKKSDGTTKTEKYQLASFDPVSMELELIYLGSFLEKLKGSQYALEEVELLYKFNIGQINYFGTGFLKEKFGSPNYLFEIGKANYRGQQRTNYRLSSTPSRLIKFKIDQTVFQALDISASGISLKVPETMKELFIKGKVFKVGTVGFSGNQYEISEFSVVFVGPLSDNPNEPLIKVALHFDEFDTNVEHRLSLDISMEARGEEVARAFSSKK